MENYPTHPVLIVDDEINILKAFKVTLKYSGITNIITCQDSKEVMPLLQNQPVEVILLDLIMPHIPGEELLRGINEHFPQIPVIIITAVNNLDTAVSCMKFGAVDYMVKPVERNRLVSGVRRLLELQELKRENLTLKNRILADRLDRPDVFSNIVTNDDKMISIFKYMEAVAASEEPVLITGETGTGKELFAHALHQLSSRKGKFVSVNVSGLDDNMFSDTLFGHRRGAFTDAHQARKGLVEQAVEGTLFLDEIGELSPASQVKLLRLLQEKEYYKLGSDQPYNARGRGLFSTNRNLEELAKSGQFRKDLYYRIHTHHIHIPPLRERLDDLPLLIEHFLNQASTSMKKTKPRLSPEIHTLLSNYDFPGNIRELRAMIFDAVSTTHSQVLSMEPFKKLIPVTPGPVKKKPLPSLTAPLDLTSLSRLPTMKQAEESLITEAMNRSAGNISKAAKMLGLTRQTLSKRLKKIQVK
ncbi:MAG: sigma-54-dependent Fis family transcriptional regulator [Candidatus Aminicenantes bacterium]|nr:MAG: sigma-54-dependent Fis family transcriptional regulator [Candidatus Aminicenantes bacterium]